MRAISRGGWPKVRSHGHKYLTGSVAPSTVVSTGKSPTPLLPPASSSDDASGPFLLIREHREIWSYFVHSIKLLCYIDCSLSFHVKLSIPYHTQSFFTCTLRLLSLREFSYAASSFTTSFRSIVMMWLTPVLLVATSFVNAQDGNTTAPVRSLTEHDPLDQS